jgi:hypothetical protein
VAIGKVKEFSLHYFLYGGRYNCGQQDWLRATACLAPGSKNREPAIIARDN